MAQRRGAGGARHTKGEEALVHGGRQRLARNLLMDVLRRWAARLPEIVENVAALTANAEACAREGAPVVQGELRTR